MKDDTKYKPKEIKLEVPVGFPPHTLIEFSARKHRYCVIVVARNEGERLKEQLKRMRPLAELIDIILVDNDSNDNSTAPEFLESMRLRAMLNTPRRGLSLATRIGYAFAMREGYSGAITVDGNGKDGVEALPEFIKLLDQGYDLIQGSRFIKGGQHKNTPRERYIAIRFIMAPLLGSFCGFYYTDPTNAFRACSERFLKDPRVSPLRSVFVRFNLHHYLNYRAAKLKFRVRELAVRRDYPEDGSVPTKIYGLKTRWIILWEMILTLMGRYNPR